MATVEFAAPAFRAGRAQANQNDHGNRGLGFELVVQSRGKTKPVVHRLVLAVLSSGLLVEYEYRAAP